MAIYDLIRCRMTLPPEVAGVSEWRTEDLGIGYQTIEIDAEGRLRQFHLERRLHSGHPARPALLDPGYHDWLRDWTTLETCSYGALTYSGPLRLAGRDASDAEWAIEAQVAAGRCQEFKLRTRPLSQSTPDHMCLSASATITPKKDSGLHHRRFIGDISAGPYAA